MGKGSGITENTRQTLPLKWVCLGVKVGFELLKAIGRVSQISTIVVIFIIIFQAYIFQKILFFYVAFVRSLTLAVFHKIYKMSTTWWGVSDTYCHGIAMIIFCI